jgi:hypothetical protein
MTDNSPEEGQGQELSDEQRAVLEAQTAQQAATSPNPSATLAQSLGQMAGRGPELPAEADMDKMMAALKAQSEQIAALQAQVGVMQKQAEETQAAAGGPLTVRYADAAVAKLQALKAQHPDVPAGHFDAAITAAQGLAQAARGVVKTGAADVAKGVETAAADLTKFVTKTHWRASGKFIDFSALADDVETAVEEALKLVA